MTNNILNFVNLAKYLAFAITRISKILEILISIRKYKQKAVEQTCDNDSIN